MTLRVGSIVYATDSGLGILAKSFFDHGIITHPIVVRHGRHVTHEEWYPRAQVVGDVRHLITAGLKFLGLIDVLLLFETPFEWNLIPWCREHGIRTALVPMYECSHERLNDPRFRPDLFINPSALDQVYFPDGVQLPVPVAVPWRQRTRAEVFVHNAGHGGLKGRNGTAELLEAIPLVESPAQFIIRSQERLRIQFDEVDSGGNDGERWGGSGRIGACHVGYWGGTFAAESLWTEGDVFVFPERHNGLSLPLQEAFASGMLVMAGDRFPNYCYLPKEPLIPVQSYCRDRIGPPYPEFDSARFDPQKIARTIDNWFGKDISGLSLAGRDWAMANSWEVLKPRWLEVLNALCS